MKIGLVGPTHDQRSLPFNAQRSINLYPVMDEQGKEVSSMYGTPGLLEFSTSGSGPHRGAFKSGDNRAFFVSGISLVEVMEDGSFENRGSLLSSSGTVSMAEGVGELAICDGNNLYSFTYNSNVFTKVFSSGLPASVGYVTNLDGYFIVNENDSGRFYISGINNLSTWNPLDFATAESRPDYLVAPVSALGQLWLFGETTLEPWSNRGAADFPFRRVGSNVIAVGLYAKHSVLEIDNTLIWVGRDKFGAGVVFRANGFSPSRISTTPIEKKIQEASSPQDIYTWAYQEEGAVHIVFSGGGLETSLVYDLSTQQWHERAFLNADGNFEQHLGSCHIYAFGKHLVGDRRNGNIYHMDMDYYSDNGREIARERVYTHISDEMKRTRFTALHVGFEVGVGNADTPNPIAELSFSRDGGKTYSNPIAKSIGRVGEYLKEVMFRRIGITKQLTFKLRITGKTKIAITGSYLT